MQTTFYLAPLDKATLQDSKGNLFNDTKSIKVNQATIQKAIREGKAIKVVVDGDNIKMTTTQQVEVSLKGQKPLPIDFQEKEIAPDVPKEQAELIKENGELICDECDKCIYCGELLNECECLK